MEAVQTPNPPSFETVWAALQETDRILKENAEREIMESAKRHKEFELEMMEESAKRHKEFEHEMKERAEKHEHEMKERAEKHEHEMKERAERFERERRKSEKDFNERLGNYINLFGEVTEYEMSPKMREKFTEFGFSFPKTTRNVSIRDSANNIFLEIDAMLENGDTAILVEIKTKLTIERINYHISRLEKMRKYADLHGDKRTFFGAVAGVAVTDDVRDYAAEQGFYLITPMGHDLNIAPPNGKPKEW